ncbi:MAG: hypothetical protein CSA70_01370 [Rhodobacterales bacterium]|nr:MAG: hypothetical protein CSA70_01370 [Rhodobacterales bacterium]
MPIVTRILSALTPGIPAPAPLPEPDARLALGALMVRVAKSDHTYVFAEIARIDRLLARLNHINPVEAAKMRATCERLNAEAPDTETFATLIRENVPFDQRIEALSALWSVVLADGRKTPDELEMIESTRAALGLSEDDSETARTKAG